MEHRSIWDAVLNRSRKYAPSKAPPAESIAHACAKLGETEEDTIAMLIAENNVLRRERDEARVWMARRKDLVARVVEHERARCTNIARAAMDDPGDGRLETRAIVAGEIADRIECDECARGAYGFEPCTAHR